jgi:hypothetical protein
MAVNAAEIRYCLIYNIELFIIQPTSESRATPDPDPDPGQFAEITLPVINAEQCELESTRHKSTFYVSHFETIQ